MAAGDDTTFLQFQIVGDDEPIAGLNYYVLNPPLPMPDDVVRPRFRQEDDAEVEYTFRVIRREFSYGWEHMTPARGRAWSCVTLFVEQIGEMRAIP